MDQLYRKSLGLPVDESRLAAQRANHGFPSREVTVIDNDTYNLYDGSDLMIQPAVIELEFVTAQIKELEAYFDSENDQSVTRLQLAPLLEQTEDVQVMLGRELDARSQEDDAFARATQGWVAKEISHRSEERGHMHPQGTEAAHIETIDILEKFIAELNHDDEDEALIRLAQTWYQETVAQLSLEQLKRFYALAA